jgi:cytochrome c556
MVDLYAQLPEEYGATVEQEATMHELAQVAAKTADAARHIPDVLAEVKLSQSEREIFSKLAKKLETEARELQQHAEEKDTDEIQSSMDEMIATCNACHTAFRVMPAATRR